MQQSAVGESEGNLMPLTLSGRRVARDTTEHPSLTDIAVGLSRMPRFAGQTTHWFSVLDHTMLGLYLIEADGFAYRYDKRWWLLHDAHESMTGDVPTDLKGAELRFLQRTLDERIFAAFYPRLPLGPEGGEHEARIKELDSRCLRAEAVVLKEGRTIGGAPLVEDVALLKYHLGQTLGRPPFWKDQHRHPLVRQYVSKLIELM